MSEVRPGFKLTEVGVIPEDWSCSDLRSLGQVVRGGSPRPAGDPRYFNGSFRPWLTVASLTGLPSSHLYVRRTATALTEAGAKRSRELRRGTFILANSGFSLGIAKILDIDCCANDGIAAVIGLDERVCPPFLANFINSITDYLREIVATGNDQPNLNTDRIGRIYVPIPPLPEQQAAAEALADADALIEGLEALITKKRDIKHGAMQELLTGERRLPGFGGEWATQLVGSIFDFGRSVPLSRAQLSTEGDVQYVHYGDIHTRLHIHLDFQETSTPGAPQGLCASASPLKVGDWVFADASEDYDGVAKAIEITRLPRDRSAVAGLHTFLLRERTPTFAPGFKGYLSYSSSFRSQVLRVATGMKVFGVSKAQMKAIELHFPPILDEQRAIATVLSDMETEILALEDKLAKAHAVKQGMMQVLLTGEIRLI